MKIDQDSGHAYVIEELDEQTLVVKEVMLGELKGRLDEVSRSLFLFWSWCWEGGGVGSLGCFFADVVEWM